MVKEALTKRVVLPAWRNKVTQFQVISAISYAASISTDCPKNNSVEEIRNRIIKDGCQTFVKRCVRCGHTSLLIKASLAKQEGRGIPEYDYNLEGRWRTAKHLAYEAVRETIKPQI